MSQTSPESPPARLFIALELPAEVRAGIDRWGSAGAARPGAAAAGADERSTSPWSSSATRRPSASGGSPRCCCASTGSAPRLELAPQPVSLPRGRRPGLFALEVRSERVAEIEAELAAALAEAGLHRPEERPFFPHVTVARVRREKGRRGKPQRVADPPGRLPEALLRPFLAVRVALYLSSFGPGGVQYSPLAQVELPSGEAAVR